jgi:hypothetical protein
MDVINPEQVKDPALLLSFLIGIFIRLRLVLLSKLVHVPSWPLRESQPTSEHKVWLPTHLFNQSSNRLILSVSSRWRCTNGLYIHSQFQASHLIFMISERSRNDQKDR